MDAVVPGSVLTLTIAAAAEEEDDDDDDDESEDAGGGADFSFDLPVETEKRYVISLLCKIQIYTQYFL